MGVTSEYELIDNVDLGAQEALLTIGGIAEEMKYKGKLAMIVVAKHTPANNLSYTEEADISVEINTDPGDESIIGRELEQCDSSLNGVGTLNPRILYRHGNTFAFQVDIGQSTATVNDSIRFMVWAPGNEGRSFCESLLRHAESLWQSLSSNPTLN